MHKHNKYNLLITIFVFIVLVVFPFAVVWVSSGLAQKLDDAAHLVGNADLLRALGQASLAIHTLVGAGIGRQGFAIARKESLLAFGIIGR